MTELVKLDYAQVEQSWDNWLDAHFGLDCDETSERYFKFLAGDRKPNEVEIGPWDDTDDNGNSLVDDNGQVDIPPDLAEKFRQLCSPHFKTIIYAWYKVHPWK